MTFLPRDFIETVEGLMFAVVARGVEDDKALAFLRYVPDAGGHRKISTEDANRLLRERHPHYLHYSTQRDTHLHAVPIGSIRHHHRPRTRAREILQGGPADGLEVKLAQVLRLLIESGVDRDCLGVTGSLLIRRQNAHSDLDVVVYGRDQFQLARDAVCRLTDLDVLNDLDALSWRETYARRGCTLSFEEFLRHERRKGNKGMIAGTKFDLALVQDEEPQPAGSWRKLHKTTLCARVKDATQGYDHPAYYLLDHTDVPELLCFTHTYAGQARCGELVEACGSIEESSDGKKRLVVGSSREAPGEYVRVIWEQIESSVYLPLY